MGTTRYASCRFYYNFYLLRFGEDGRCAEFVEWFMAQPPQEMSQ